MKKKLLSIAVMSAFVLRAFPMNYAVTLTDTPVIAAAAETEYTLSKTMLHDAIVQFEPLHIKMSDSVPSGTETKIIDGNGTVLAY